MDYIAHKTEDGRLQTVKEHLIQTAALAGGFAAVFGAEELGEQAGMLHDIGKYSREFQARILEDGQRVDHATAGAKALWESNPGMMPIMLSVAGHHTGLPDLGGKMDDPELPTLFGRIKRTAPRVPNCSAWKDEIVIKKLQCPEFSSGFEASFFTRMLFSCLVDADFLDTEAFMSQRAVERGGQAPLTILLICLQQYIAHWSTPSNRLNAVRGDILNQCIHSATAEPGLFTLTVPTGGGKTVASLAFALNHALHTGKKRIIYVIPYTSIIEQTADKFREILGADNVLEHHSGVVYEDTEDGGCDKRRLATENWDAPVVVTTNVQFFESLYANKSSRCRKLHNIADSVIIFDEAQMLPLPYLLPCVRAIQELVIHFGVTAVLCTATQPSLEKLFSIELPIRSLCHIPENSMEVFKRNVIHRGETLTTEQLAERMSDEPQTLAIMNTKKQAAELYHSLPKQGSFHLSTSMAPVHRRQVLAAIRQALQTGEVCRVAATSLVEAGVDLDFQRVYRAEAGLDSIIQAAGRCNREGKRPWQQSIVSVFKTDVPPPSSMAANMVLMREALARFAEIDSEEAVKAYFDALHDFKGDRLDEKKIISAFDQGRSGCLLPFAQIADDVKLIDSSEYRILIPYDDTACQLAQRLMRGEFSRKIWRQAAQYMVNLYKQQFEEMWHAGVLKWLDENTAVLTDMRQYDEATGLIVETEGGQGFFI